ncbi:MAG: DUF1592 domain-containing protein [Planctomycetes bacterium]|nr:DUF1592 domain-containing protein [Planctomycetota bacterium]
MTTGRYIPLTCKSCGFAFKVESRFAGKVGACPNPDCRRRYLVPPAARSGRLQPANAIAARSGRHQPANAISTPPSPAPRATRSGRSQPADAAAIEGGTRRVRFLTGIGLALAGLIATAFLAWPAGNAPEASAAVAPPADESRKADDLFKTRVQPFVTKFCIDCHTGEDAMAGIALDSYTTADSVVADRKTWDRVLRMVESGAMPPADHDPLPVEDERRHITEWIDAKLYFVDCTLPHDPGRVTIRRLNKSEYNNTIRDLVGVEFRPADDFPSDDVGEGFDNIGDVLSLPPLLMEKYLDAAEAIAERAIVADPSKLKTQLVDAGRLKTDGGDLRDDHISLSSTGSAWFEFNFPRDGDYVLRAEAAADQAGPEVAKMAFRLDGKEVKVHEVQGRRKWDFYEHQLTVKEGRRRFDAAFINDYYKPDAEEPRERDRNLAVRSLEVRGPLGVSAEDLPETHRRIVFTRPKDDEPATRAAREVVRKFANRAFRRPATDDEVERFAGLVEISVERGDTFERGVSLAVQAMLVSPQFLFRVETDRNPDDPADRHALNDWELATRLSYFLWSSMPDEELFSLAERGELHKVGVLRQQARRMLQDPKAEALVENFAGQWLNLRNLDELTPDPDKFPEFDDELKADMRRETMLFFRHVMRGDASVLDLLDGRYTFLNERLAEHYGLGGVKGEEFQRVSLDGTQRAGLFTHASILTLTSNPTRTSPVKRGKWILENILGTPPPPPPPDVPDLEEAAKAKPGASLREQLEVHRENAVCASCHRTMDALGFGLENFDVLGRWRERDAEDRPIDASGELPGGARFDGPLQLAGVLRAKQDRFRRTLAEKMLTFALGRGLQYYDRCAVDEITKAVQADNDRFSALVTEIVVSEPFTMRRGEAE